MKIFLCSLLVAFAMTVASAALAADGSSIYAQKCQMCHGADGAGSAMGPALAGTDLIKGDAEQVKALILNGVPRETKKYPNFPMAMPPVPLSEAELSAVIEYMKGL